MAGQKESYQATIQETLQKHLKDRFWRLNNLYYILDEKGAKVLFKMNMVQHALYVVLHWLNIIPKSRQHGITTFVAIFILDACLFNDDMSAGIVAHKLKDAQKIFRKKIRYAYTHLPEDIKACVTLVKDGAEELEFSNGSSIYVGTSMRSGTLQILHVSEYGWLCTHKPQQAAEVKAGAMETVHEGGIIFVESTFESPTGDFADICDLAEGMRLADKELGPLDWKIHFFAWFQKDTNTTDPKYVDISDKMHQYFDKVEQLKNTVLTLPQRAWYSAKKNTLGRLIYKEHPSTFEEAKQVTVVGAYYGA